MEVPNSVNPNLFRDLGFGEAVVGGIGLVVGKSKRHRLTVESFSVLGIKNLFFVDQNREARASRFRPGALSE
jgi:hypothetical protein